MDLAIFAPILEPISSQLLCHKHTNIQANEIAELILIESSRAHTSNCSSKQGRSVHMKGF